MLVTGVEAKLRPSASISLLGCVLTLLFSQAFAQLLPSFPRRTIVDVMPLEKENRTFAGTFIVVAPRVIRPGLPFSASVNILQSADDAIVNLKIRDSKNFTIAQTYASRLQAGTPVIARIEQIPFSLMQEEQYKLYVKGETINRVLFEVEEELRFERKSQSIFVQTDKAMYKPGATVNYRVIVISPNLLPYNNGTVDIKISDPQNNVIAQYMGERPVKGVIGKELSLSDEPPLGDWKIEVTLDGQQKYTKTFSVDKYVLPKFEVKLTLPPISTVTDDVVVLVSARYTYGKGVGGKVLVRAENPWSMNWYAKEYPPIEETATLDENGEATSRLSNEELKRNNLVSVQGYNTIRLTATVTEQLTGIQRNGTGEVTVFPHAMKLVLTKQADNFKPGLDYILQVSVVSQDDKVYSKAAGESVYLKLSYYLTSRMNSTIEPFINKTVVQLGNDGTAVLVIQPPVNADSVEVEAHYQEIDGPVHQYTSVSSARSPTQNYLQLISKQAEVRAGQEISFTLKSTEVIPWVTVQVMNRGFMVFSRVFAMNSQETIIEFATNAEMAPKSRLIAYAVRRANKEILVDALDFNVKGLFANDVSVAVSPTRAEPNNTVEIRVKADPQSYVGLCSVDQSVLLLKSGNDITQDLVERDIAEYDSTNNGFFGGRNWEGPVLEVKRRKRSTWWPWMVSGKDAHSIFENSGVVVLTDAMLYRELIPQRSQPIFFDQMQMLPMMAAAPPRVLDNLAEQPSAGEDRGFGQPLRVRKSFPETWIWADLVSSHDGTAVYRAVVPDTITSWITSAFAINDVSGLGVAPEPAKLEVFRPFFIRLNLPYSVKRGEKLALQVLVFNYMDVDQAVIVQLDFDPNTSGFDFIDKPGTKLSKKEKKLPDTNVNMRKVLVKAKGGSAAVFFPIVPKIVGDLKLLVRAFGQAASDAVEQTLLVEAEGMPVYFNKPLVIDLSHTPTFETSLSMNPPEATDIIPGSERMEFSIIGDIMGPILNNIDDLIRMPYGCGEQNMLNFVPNVVIAKYLNATNRLNPERENKLKKYMESGYQRELTYKRSDNSFSAFGQSDKHGSTWLTAFVVRSFKQAQPFIFIDERVLDEALRFLLQQQKENGEFEERGEVHHKAMQGGAAQGGVPLTAYVLIAFLVNGRRNADAVNYLEQRLGDVQTDAYALAVTSYALHLANSSKKDQAFIMLQNLAKEATGLKFWTQKVGGNDKLPAKENQRSWWWEAPRPVDVEITSYALLTYVLRNQVDAGLPLIRWLSTQRNSLGGFSSTQDTVLGIQALGAYAEKAFTTQLDLQIIIRQATNQITANVKQQNAIVLQKFKMESMREPVKITASGSGLAFAQLSWHYNIPHSGDAKPFDCERDVIEQSNSDDLLVHLCCKYGLEGRSNMAVIEIDAPSGYNIDTQKLELLKKSVRDLQRVEARHGDTQAAVYFNSIGISPVCFNVSSQRVFSVAEQKPSHIRVIDYYEPVNQVDLTYVARQSASIQELCPNCWQDSVDRLAPGPVTDGKAGLASSSSAASSGIVSDSVVCVAACLCAWLASCAARRL